MRFRTLRTDRNIKDLNAFFERLIANGPVLTDGAWATQLQTRGLGIGDCPDAWNLTHAENVLHVARSYVEAGSAVILTSTFGATRIALGRYGIGDRASEINHSGAVISHEAAGTSASVFGCMGPTVKISSDEASDQQLRDAYLEQARALADGGVDALVLETMFDLEEALIALAAAKETGLPVVACMTYGTRQHADRTLAGDAPEQAAGALINAGADAIGANCGWGAEHALQICIRLKAVCGNTPIWMKPNAGLPQIVNKRAVYNTSPAEFAASAAALVDAGATFIGGCCGTGPEHIAALNVLLLSKITSTD